MIVGGHNSTFDHQANINYATNRAYRIFRSAGFGAEDIFYLSPSPQDANEDGVNDVISTTIPANVHAALQWAATRVGPDVPFYLYLMDHGLTEAYCADGCTAGAIAAQDLNTWLNELETTSGANQITVLIEACHSGSLYRSVWRRRQEYLERWTGDYRLDRSYEQCVCLGRWRVLLRCLLFGGGRKQECAVQLHSGEGRSGDAAQRSDAVAGR